MNIVPKNWKTKYDGRSVHRKRKTARKLERLANLSVPITAERILTFTKHLVAVSFAEGQECWLYVGCGKGTTLPEGLELRANAYVQMTFNGETVGPHQFAFAASEGITLAELKGFDIHHVGNCFGYRCCNPDHLEKLEHVEHGYEQTRESLNPRHTRMIVEHLSVPRAARKPVERHSVSGGAYKREFFAGLPFMIRVADWVDVEGVDIIPLSD